jgi:tetratricopeptide (TPR) repeat protein
MGWCRTLLALVLATAASSVRGEGLSVARTSAGPESRVSQQDSETLAHQGIHQMMDGDLRGAVARFQQIEREDPDSPVGYLLEADATWWRIYYSTANLVDPDVFDVVYSNSTPYDSQFENLVNTSIQKAQDRIRARRDVARSYLYEGMAYALKGRLAGLRARDLAAARDAKKMRWLLLQAMSLDPHLTDADAGLGLYNYFVATLPSIVRMLRFLIGLPGGNRDVGLQELYEAAEHGDFVRGEAQFYLAKDFTRKSELQFGRSLQLFQQLCDEFPDNPFWKLMVGSVRMRLGQEHAGEVIYREVLVQTAGKHSVVANAVHQQVSGALKRLHAGQKFG